MRKTVKPIEDAPFEISNWEPANQPDETEGA